VQRELVVNSTVVAICVTYRPGADFAAEIQALCRQVPHVIVVDNGSHGKHRELLERLAEAEQRVELLLRETNEGIGAAHNAGIRRARELNATHVLLMDQDSLPQADMVQQLLRAEHDLVKAGRRLAAVGPVYHDPRLMKTWPFFRMSRFGVRPHACDGRRYVACDFLISSGTLIPMLMLDAIGGMREDYFLEHVDTEWSLRARFAAYELYGVCAARMDHHLGDAVVSVPFTGHKVQLYRPYRHYYLFRNALLLWNERHARLPWKMNEVKRLFYRLVFFSVFVPPRFERLKFMLLGIWHGIIGKTGPLEV
jgi:rhamnosyltransferase